jgi:serine kinase of HPr protein (carbohydrate metabolism regulator)
MAAETPTIHATAVLIGARAILIRGPAGSGKSRLALDVIEAAHAGALSFARLVGDDRVSVTACHGRLIVRPAQALAGLVEVRGAGIRRLAFEPAAVVGLVVDLAALDADRLPEETRLKTEIAGIKLPRLAVAPGVPALPLLLSLRQTVDSPGRPQAPANPDVPDPGEVAKK